MKKSILIAVFAVITAATVAKAQMDFDGNAKGGIVDTVKEISASDPGVSAPGMPAREFPAVKSYDEDESNVYQTGSKCVGKDCQDGWPGYACNLKTCGKSRAVRSVSAGDNAASLAEIIAPLDDAKKLKFYASLSFRDGKLAGAYTKDIENDLGESGLKAVLGILGMELPKTEKDITTTDYIKDHKCVAPATCHSAAGYTCTENC